MRRRQALIGIFAMVGLTAVACEEDSNTTTGTEGSGAAASGGSSSQGAGSSTGGTSSGGTSAGGTSAGGNTGGNATGGSGQGLVEAPCGPQTYQCGDTIDNDGDGLIDSDDPDCLGPCDDTEDGYHPELPGWSGDACHQDCFWDTGNGSNEDCWWDHKCDPLSVSPNYDPEGIQCEYQGPDYQIGGVGNSPTCSEALASQSDECLDFCTPLSPNGCDCFGCCELPAGSGDFVFIGSYDDSGDPTCFLDVVTDTTKCRPCTPVPSCQNDCATCELCIGKPFLPPECFDPPGTGGGSGTGGSGGGDPQECPPGIQGCGLVGQDPCPSGTFCITGCCMPLPQ